MIGVFYHVVYPLKMHRCCYWKFTWHGIINLIINIFFIENVRIFFVHIKLLFAFINKPVNIMRKNYKISIALVATLFTASIATGVLFSTGLLLKTSDALLNTIVRYGSINIVQAATATLGNTNVGSTQDSDNSNYMNVTRFTMPNETGTAQSMSVYTGTTIGASPNNQYSMAIYADASGAPGSLIASTANGTLSGGAWNTLPISATLSPNTTYWFAYNTNGTASNQNNTIVAAGSVGQMGWKAQAFGTWPASFGTPDGTSNFAASIYVTYAQSGGTTDTIAPTVPTSLTATAVSSSAINLAWTASTDAVGVTGYKIFRAGTQIGTSATNAYSDIGLAASTAYSYTVSAYDAAGNNSAQSSAASATTQSVGTGGNWYVRSGATGNGTSWASAWGNVTSIAWSSIQPGDTVWIAGGSYGNLVPGKSGTGDADTQRIKVKRATASAHGSDTGWSAGYDSQVVLSGITWSSAQNYVTIDGQIDSGIFIAHTTGNAIGFDAGATYVTLRYIETSGPGTSTTYHHNTDDRGLDLTPSSGALIGNMKLQHMKVHGACTLLWFQNTDNMLMEDSSIYDSHDDTGSVCHPNLIATSGSTNVTIRNNNFYNYDAEGIMFLYGGAGTWYFYGNIFNGGNGGPYNRVVSSEGGANGPVYFYNNTVINLWATITGDTGSSYVAGSVSANNIFWDADCDGWITSRSYNLGNGTCSGTGSISAASNPFVNFTGGNYHINATVGAKYPKDKGTNLGSPYNLDMDGNARGADGTWDIGAYEL
jgi:hypothetical protein